MATIGNKYMFVISARCLIGFDGDLDFSKVNLPSTLWKNYYSIETNGDKVLCKDCIIEDYQGFEHFFGGLDPLEHESEKRNEIFNNLWADGHHQKAKDMLCHQLLKDFGGEALSNAEIVETAKGRKDGFRFSSDEMSVSVSFNKEWVAKMWVDSNNMYSGGYVPSAY